MATLPILNRTTGLYQQFAVTGFLPYAGRQQVVVEGHGDNGMTVMTDTGRAELDLIGNDGVVTIGKIHFWDAGSWSVPLQGFQIASEFSCNNSLHGTAPNAMYTRCTPDNGAHNHQHFYWYFNGSMADSNPGNCSALGNFGVGLATDIWAGTPAVSVFSIANGTAPTSITGAIHLYAASGDLKVLSPNGSGAQLTNNPRWTTITNSSLGVQMDLHQYSSAPAIGDNPGFIRFRGQNSSAVEISYAEIHGSILDPTAATASGRFEIWTSAAGASAARAYVANGLMVGTSTDPGAGGIMLKPASSITPGINGELTFQATSNTSLTIKYKGSDGTVRSNVLTLA